MNTLGDVREDGGGGGRLNLPSTLAALSSNLQSRLGLQVEGEGGGGSG